MCARESERILVVLNQTRSSRSRFMPSRAVLRFAIFRWAVAAFCGFLTNMPPAARSDSLLEPPVFESSNGVLDVLIIAKAKPVQAISFKPQGNGELINPTGWVYEVCPRPNSANECPAD